MTNTECKLGEFYLDGSQVAKINDYDNLDITEVADGIIAKCSDYFTNLGLNPPTLKFKDGHHWLCTYEPGMENVGDTRVRWSVINCKEYSIIAQQIRNDKDDTYTFRTWNPDKL